MSGLSIEKRIIAAVWNRKALWVIHFVANAALAGLIYEWLWIPDRTVLHLAISAISAVAIIALILWLQAGTLAHFRTVHAGQEQGLGQAFIRGLRRLLPFAVWAGILVFAIFVTLGLDAYRESVSNSTASFLTLHLRRPVTPASIARVFWWALLFSVLVLFPMFLLPLGCSTADEGFRGFGWKSARRSFSALKRVRNWLGYVLLLIPGVAIPYKLIWWVPQVDGLYSETASLVARFLVAYVLIITSWLLVASMAGSWAGRDDPQRN